MSVEHRGRQQRRPAWPTAVLVGLLVALTVVLAGMLGARMTQRPPSTSASRPPSKVTMASPDEVVRNYFMALAANDVATALSYGPQPNLGSTALLNSDVYAHSLREHPISAITIISIMQRQDSDAVVRVGFKMGTKQVDETFATQRGEHGVWQMRHTTLAMQLQTPGSSQVPLSIYGVALGIKPTVDLLPGFYPVSTGVPFLAFGDTNTITVESPGTTGTAIRTLTPSLTTAGESALLLAGRESLTSCLAQQTLTPANCPNQLHGVSSYAPSSVRWSVVADPFASAEATLNSSDPSSAQVRLPKMVFKVSYKLSAGTTAASTTTSPATIVMSASMVVLSAGDLHVRWAAE